jgi:hypothetical protein
MPTLDKLPEDYTIDVDVKRSMINSIFDRNNHEHLIDQIKLNLNRVIKTYYNIDRKYHYYQGFHDIALYMHLLFINNDNLQIQSLQRLSEYFFKDFLVKQEKPFPFEVVYHIINDVVESIDKRLFIYIKTNSDIDDPLFALAWVVTFFTHDICDLFFTYRIFDYLLFAKPYAVFHLAANVNML